ncbi:MAG TPA: glycerophosphoryl diester phosphodiesterase membrane domain-containing protein [Candidatus Dormibacteraeota bacterium]
MAVEPFRFRPLTVADLLDESFRIYRANFAVLASIAVAAYLPQLLIVLASGTQDIYTAALQTMLHPGTPTDTGTIPGYNPLRSLISLLNYPVQLAVAPFQYGTPILAATWTVLGYRVSLESAIRGLLRFFWPTVLTLLLYLAASFTLVCFPVGLWLFTRLALVLPSLYAEQAGVGRALERSWALTRGAFWRTFWLFLVLGVMLYVVSLVLAPVLVTAAALIPELPLWLRVDLGLSVVGISSAIIYPLFAIGDTLVYFDLRVRREAFDLDFAAGRLAARAAGTA